MPSQSYALSKKVTTDNRTDTSNGVISTQKPQETEADEADKADQADKADEEDKADKEVNDTTDDRTTKSDNNVTTTSPVISEPTTQVEGVKDEDDAKDKKDDIDEKDKKDEEDKEDLWYRSQNPMKKEHQMLLWEYCKEREINYIDMLALIYTESGFDEKCSTGKYYGYFQISKGNCANLADTLKTKNKPFDGAININWGTSMYSEILADKRVKDLEGKKQRDVALSIYQRGTGGYDKYGINTKFLKTFYTKRAKVCKWFEEE